jgi:hypothetical protein
MLMSTTESRRAERAPGAALFGLYGLALAWCILANLLVRLGARGGWLPAWGQLALAVTGVVPLVAAAVWFWQMLRDDLDEMLQRIVLEGMAMALTVYVPLAALYVNLRTAGLWAPRLDPPDILFAPALLVAVGIAVAARRYR